MSWKQAVQTPLEFCLPGILTVLPSGACIIGNSDAGEPFGGLKLGLMEGVSKQAQVRAVAFIALVTRYTRAWLFERYGSIFRGLSLDWFMNVGLPSIKWEDGELHRIYRTVCAAGWDLGATRNQITLDASEAALESPQSALSLDDSKIDAIPEFVAQVAGYVRSSKRQGDLHALLDVGAGTLDIVTFNVNDVEHEDEFPIFSSDVTGLGTHYLLASRAKAINQLSHNWLESDATLSTDAFAHKYGDRAELVSLTNRYAKHVGERIRRVLGKTRADRYGSSPTWTTGLPVFVCGGGRGIDAYQRGLDYVKSVYYFKIESRNLPVPEDLHAPMSEGDFHRISVAYGLSYHADELGKIYPRSQVEDLPRYLERRTDFRDRFVDKEQT